MTKIPPSQLSERRKIPISHERRAGERNFFVWENDQLSAEIIHKIQPRIAVCTHCEEDFEEIAKIIAHTQLADQIIFCDPKRVPKSFYEFVGKNPQIPCSYFQGHLMRNLENFPVFDVLFYRCIYDDAYGHVDFRKISEKMAVEKGYIISTSSKNHSSVKEKIKRISSGYETKINEKISRIFSKDTTILQNYPDAVVIRSEWVYS